MEIKTLVAFLLLGFCASCCSAATYRRPFMESENSVHEDPFSRFQPEINFLDGLSSEEDIFQVEQTTTEVTVPQANKTLPPELLEWYKNVTTKAQRNSWNILLARVGRVAQYPPGISKIREYLDMLKNKTYDFVTGPSYNAVVDELKDTIIHNITPLLMTISLEDIRQLGLMMVKNPEYLERIRTSDVYLEFSEKNRKKDEQMENQLFQKLQEVLSDPEVNANIRAWFENPSFEALDRFLGV